MKIPNYGVFWEFKTACKLILKNGLIWNFDPLFSFIQVNALDSLKTFRTNILPIFT